MKQSRSGAGPRAGVQAPGGRVAGDYPPSEELGGLEGKGTDVSADLGHAVAARYAERRLAYWTAREILSLIRMAALTAITVATAAAICIAAIKGEIPAELLRILR